MMSAYVLVLVVLSQPIAHPPPVYGVLRCSKWPASTGLTSAAGVKIRAEHHRPNRIMIQLKHAGGHREHMAAWYLGIHDGWHVWSVLAPPKVAELIAASPLCRAWATYTQAFGWPKADRDWIAHRSTCHGEATWRGRDYTVWPCSWATERIGEGTVKRLDGIGPGITAGVKSAGVKSAGVKSGGH